MKDNLILVILFLAFCCLVISFLIIRDVLKRKRVPKFTPTRPKPKPKRTPKYADEQIKKLASECKLVSDRLNTLLAISSIDCTGKTIQQQLEEIADLVSLRFRDRNISISCSIDVSLPSYSSVQEQVIHVASKNHTPTSKVAISEDLVISNKFVGKIQIHTMSDSDLIFLEGEKPFLRSVSRVVSKVMTKMISQTKLRERIKMFKDILDSSAIIALVLDSEFHVVFHNRALKDLIGWTYKDFKTMSFFDIIEIETGQDIREIQDQEVSTFISTVRHKDGTLARVIWDVSKLDNGKLLLIGRDITREFNLRSKTIRSQQEVYLERIAKAVANDLNNCLTTITTQIELILSEKKRLTKKKVKTLLESVQACSRTVDRLLTLTKIRTSDDNLNLSEIIEELISKLDIPKNVSLAIKCEENLVAKINESQLVTILDSLIKNSIEAQATEIKVLLNKEVVPLEEVDGSIYSGLFVKLSVVDNGTGIKESYLEKVFEPYFSTKRNLGLGLTIVRKIANSYGGFVKIVCYNGGTTVGVYLPKANKTTGKQIQDIRVLIVDDDETVSGVIQKLLETRGVQSEIANSGSKALELCSQKYYDVIILDMMLPDVKGLDLIHKLEELQPNSNIIVCSGYPDGDLDSKQCKISCYLKKPFEIPELFEVLERVVKGNG